MKKIFLLFFCFLFVNNIFAKEERYKYEKILFLPGIPWGMTFIEKNRLLITNKDGNIFLYNVYNKDLKKLEHNLKIMNKGQGGLLDIKISVNFKNDSFIYVTYVKQINKKLQVVLARAKYKKVLKFVDIFISKISSKTSKHFGSRISFDKNNHVFISIGDRGIRPLAQDLSSHAGSIIRLNLDGSIPFDNPFVNKKNVLQEIYSYGHRNPQGLFFDTNRNILFSSEHGPRGGDEINIIKKAANYGWPEVSYGKEYTSFSYVGEARKKVGYEDAIKVYIPSIAPSSLLVYSGNVFKQWKGDLFIGALKLRHINHIILDKNLKVIKEERLFENLNKRIRNIIEDKEGNIYFSSDSGSIYKITKE